MKRVFFGLLSIVLLVASVLGPSSKGPEGRRSGRSSGPAMWI